jgi:hypothetical protein
MLQISFRMSTRQSLNETEQATAFELHSPDQIGECVRRLIELTRRYLIHAG